MKKLTIYIACAFACCLLFLFSGPAAEAAGRGFLIWRDSLLPALLPFFVCAYVMQNLGVPAPIERTALAVLCMVSGAPSGARLLSGCQSPDTRSAAVLNTVSPMFIYASFCTGMLGAPGLAWPIITAQFSASALMLLLFPLKYGPPLPAQREEPSLRLLARGLSSGMGAMLNICAALVFFMALLGALTRLLGPLRGPGGAIAVGMAEMVCGCRALSALPLPPRIMAAAAAFLFSFGGLCIFAQSLVFCPLSFTKYFSVKLLQGAAAAAAAYFLTPLFPCARAAFSPVSPDRLAHNTASLLSAAWVSLISMAAVMMAGAAARYRKLTRRRQ